MAISGGAIWTSVSWAVQRDHDGNTRYAMRVYVILHAVMLVIVGIINLHPKVRHWVDPDRSVPAPTENGEQGV
jgi:hypothetical protein